MRPVDVGVGHDDDLVIAQIVEVEFRAHADAERLAEIVDLGIGRQLAGGNAALLHCHHCGIGTHARDYLINGDRLFW